MKSTELLYCARVIFCVLVAIANRGCSKTKGVKSLAGDPLNIAISIRRDEFAQRWSICASLPNDQSDRVHRVGVFVYMLTASTLQAAVAHQGKASHTSSTLRPAKALVRFCLRPSRICNGAKQRVWEGRDGGSYQAKADYALA